MNLRVFSNDIDLEKVKALTDLGVKEPSTILDSLHMENTFFHRFLVGQIVKGNGANIEEIAEYYKHKLPWIIFSLMPVFAFVLFLVYVRRKIYFSDHLIYAFHLHTAVFLIFSIIAIINWFSIDWLSKLLVLYIPFYYFVSLKKVYKQSWLKTTLKGMIVGGLYMMLGLVCFMFIATLLFVVY
jgi:ABC-type multidrug transport system fused ATPase/permease subunit